jgi:pimeloyl-ACP methyl ester carboxylesterase
MGLRDVSESGELLLRAGGVELCAETFGERADPALLLIMGAGASMDWWDAELCRRLAAEGRFVIRYDTRDTGRSVTYARGAPEYGFRDLVGDAVGLLDALGVVRGHIAGFSLGGSIAQVAALEYPERVASLTLIATSPGGGGDLPGMTPALRTWYEQAAAPPDPPEREATVEYEVAAQRAHAAASQPFDADEARATARRAFDRTRDPLAAPANLAVMADGAAWREQLGELRMPVLVLHGREDPLFPAGHALALARGIPAARLVWLDGMGHELPRRVWATVVAEIAEHTGS